ncbi:fumarylacetoacetate hydrolase family protein [Echinimonas agarilytica]|uniref:Fumarylacetoacetate hydrolase family protein n=1 Tax=Echinimonas agarilytica TaxID=1215918 RepID=A0AA41WAM7_9GAMM|nr:fumarylacetoacetate hydrolase family protein [Echinimonas agarilytica]MCM2681238.1 fumarylacetoacetate hydrolase family protein [Echinimonas agarilytica]
MTNSILPHDEFAGSLLGRVWLPSAVTGSVAGPAPVWITEHGVYDLSPLGSTCAELLNNNFSKSDVDLTKLSKIGDFEDIAANSIVMPDLNKAYFLSPFDVQAIKACGVTFICSMLERVIEERAEGDAEKAAAVRNKIHARIGDNINDIKPGSEEAETLKAILQQEGLWSQYLEVGIGPYAEVFTKSQPLSSVGIGAEVGLHPISNWNNPEPEVVLAVNRHAEVLGATLGNDVNLRDVEGRSALLLGKAKDNNASCSLGPFIRLFDETFSIEDVRSAEVKLTIDGPEDQYSLQDGSDMSKISRDVLDLVAQTISDNHQYPDGLALFTGTLFAPTQDRGGEGQGFTHKMDDVVRISSAKLGTLTNTVTLSNKAAPWEFGITALMKNLAQRGLL